MRLFSVICESPKIFFFFFKQKTAYEMRISDWSSDVCSSDLPPTPAHPGRSRRGSPRYAASHGGGPTDRRRDAHGGRTSATPVLPREGAACYALGLSVDRKSVR